MRRGSGDERATRSDEQRTTVPGEVHAEGIAAVEDPIRRPGTSLPKPRRPRTRAKCESVAFLGQGRMIARRLARRSPPRRRDRPRLEIADVDGGARSPTRGDETKVG